uniref:Uncharacterized protein n=1 Tax=Parascaris univalens TaxID=6257 RepID=A0A915AIM0_PARUN
YEYLQTANSPHPVGGRSVSTVSLIRSPTTNAYHPPCFLELDGEPFGCRLELCEQSDVNASCDGSDDGNVAFGGVLNDTICVDVALDFAAASACVGENSHLKSMMS